MVTFTAVILPETIMTPSSTPGGRQARNLITHTGGLSDTASFVWGESGEKVVGVTAVSPTNTVTTRHTILINPWHYYYFPIMLKPN
ncbi:MAG: hypothetical protein H6662_05775 [Ardenticatenaceae bacterium]|nr:hypothetical protein [Ardenticatenaceae bacterium]